MKKTLLTIALFQSVAFAQPVLPTSLPPLPPVSTVSVQTVDLQQLSLRNLLNMLFLEYKVAYVLDPLINEDTRSVSLRWDSKRQKLDAFLPDFLDLLGYELTKKNSIYYVSKKSNSTLNLLKQVYIPKNRTASYLTDQLAPFFPNNFPARRPVSTTTEANKVKGDAPPGSAAALIDQYSDVLLFQGTQNEWSQVSKLLKQIDTAEKNVKISARLYEVSVSDKEGSSFSMLLNMANAAISLGSTGTVAGNFLQFKNATIQAVFSMIDANSKFKLVSSPFLVVKDGKSAKFESGQDVPTLGAIISQQNGTTQQSIEYKPTGVIFTVSPKIRKDSIDLQVSQTLSEVVTTTTGLSTTPTIPKRSINTQVVIEQGETIVIGGLRTQKSVKVDNGLFFFKDRSTDQQSSEILLFLTVEKGLTNEVEDANLRLSID